MRLPCLKGLSFTAKSNLTNQLNNKTLVLGHTNVLLCRNSKGMRGPSSHASPSPSIPPYGRYGDDNPMSYGYNSPTATERVAEKATPVRQGSLSFGNSRPSFAPPPSSSMFSGVDSAHHEDIGSPVERDEEHLASPSRVPAADFENGHLERWITVFGFPSTHSSVILSYFHNFGQILRVKHSENGGNWIHLLYTTKLQAEKALGKNGKILEPGNIMIGVVRCTDPSVESDQPPPMPTPSKRIRNETFNPALPYVALFLLLPHFSMITILTFILTCVSIAQRVRRGCTGASTRPFVFRLVSLLGVRHWILNPL